MSAFRLPNLSRIQLLSILLASLFAAALLNAGSITYRLLQIQAVRISAVEGAWAPDWLRRQAKFCMVQAGTERDIQVILAQIAIVSEAERQDWTRRVFDRPGATANRIFGVLSKHEAISLRRDALDYLSRYGDASVVPLFVGVLEEPNLRLAYAGVIGIRRLKAKSAVRSMMAILSKPKAPDVLTNFELMLGSTAASLVGLNLNFAEDCRRVTLGEDLQFLRDMMEMDKFPERAPSLRAKRDSYEFKRKRADCNNRGPVEARRNLLAWWRQHENEEW